jgi:hypothetical protein
MIDVPLTPEQLHQFTEAHGAWMASDREARRVLDAMEFARSPAERFVLVPRAREAIRQCESARLHVLTVFDRIADVVERRHDISEHRETIDLVRASIARGATTALSGRLDELEATLGSYVHRHPKGSA